MIRTSLFAVLLFPVLAFGEDASILSPMVGNRASAKSVCPWEDSLCKA